MSCIFYKFKSQKSESRLPIDGTGISVFELKKEIILANHMGEGKDFDLGLYDTHEEEYRDDSFVIPRSTSVVARRLPPARPGKGTAAIYVAGVNDGSRAAAAAKGAGQKSAGFGGQRAGGFNTGAHMQKRFDAKDEAPAPFAAEASAIGGDEETAKLEAMFKAQSDYWGETKDTMAQATPIFSNRGGRGGARGGGAAGGSSTRGPNQATFEPYVSDKPLPPGYICYRCGQRGHWIQNCPTNDDKEFDNRPRFKRTTGIPRSFLKTVDATAAEGAAGGIMITPEGGFVVAEPDSAAWEKQRAKPKIVTESEVRESPPTDASLACPLCTKLLTQAVSTPCCKTTYCEECIQAHLLEHDFVCPKCDEKIGSLDRLVENQEMRGKVEAYISSEIERRKFDEEGDVKPATETPKSPTPPPAAPKIPTGPAADAAAALAVQQQQEAMYQHHVATYGDPQVIQHNIQQNMMMLTNPALPPPARMQLTQNLQQLHQQLAISLQAANGGWDASAQAQAQIQQNQQQQGFHPQQQQQNQQQQFNGQQHLGPGGMSGRGAGPMNGRSPSAGHARPVLTAQEQANERLLIGGRRRGVKRAAPEGTGTGSEGGSTPKQGRF